MMFFGDSICAGSDIPDGKPSDAWPTLFACDLAGRYRVRNESRGGRPTDSHEEFEAAIAKEPAPDILVIALGANDSRDLDENMVERACANISRMIARARERKVGRIILLGTYNINKDALGPTYPIRFERERNLIKLDAAYQLLAVEARIEYLPVFGAIPESSLTVDGVHPDKAGNIPIKERVKQYFTRNEVTSRARESGSLES